MEMTDQRHFHQAAGVSRLHSAVRLRSSGRMKRATRAPKLLYRRGEAAYAWGVSLAAVDEIIYELQLRTAVVRGKALIPDSELRRGADLLVDRHDRPASGSGGGDPSIAQSVRFDSELFEGFLVEGVRIDIRGQTNWRVRLRRLDPPALSCGYLLAGGGVFEASSPSVVGPAVRSIDPAQKSAIDVALAAWNKRLEGDSWPSWVGGVEGG